MSPALMRAGQRGPSTFAALRFPDFRVLWLSLLTAQVGEPMQLFALGWLVIEISVRDGVPQLAPFFLGLLGLSRAGPGLLFGLFGGVIADRVDRRALLLVTQIAGAAVAVVLAALVFTGNITIGTLVALSVLSATVHAVQLTTQHAVIARLVPPTSLMSAVGLSNGTSNVAMLFGPLFGGLLIGPIGVAGILGLEAVLYAVAAVLLLSIKPLPPLAQEARPNMAAALIEGIAYALRDPVLRWLIGLSALISLFGRSIAGLMPAFAYDTLHVGAVELSWLLAARGLGTLVGSLGAASLDGMRRRGITLTAATLAYGVVLVAVTMQRSLLPALLLLPLTGVAQFIFSGVSNAMLQTRAPEHLRGRAVSLYLTTVTGVGPLGILLVGSLGTAVGIDVAIAIGGVLLALGGAYALFRVPALRDRSDAAPSASATTRTA